jgi:hypothetical protein
VSEIPLVRMIIFHLSRLKNKKYNLMDCSSIHNSGLKRKFLIPAVAQKLMIEADVEIVNTLIIVEFYFKSVILKFC